MNHQLHKPLALIALLGVAATSPVLLAHNQDDGIMGDKGRDGHGMMMEEGDMMGMMSVMTQMQEMMKNCNAMMSDMKAGQGMPAPSDGADQQ